MANYIQECEKQEGNSLMISQYNESIENNNLVTVFMLTHNRAKYLQLAIESVLKQDYNRFFLIILDNMSTDNTKEIVESFRKKDERVIYIQRESDGPLDNILFAFKECNTKYIIILHDDDLLKPSYLNTLLDIMEKNPYVAVSPAAETIDENGSVLGECLSNDDMVVYKSGEYFKTHYKKKNSSMIFPAVIYRTKFYKDAYLFFDRNAGPARDQLVWFETERRGGEMCFFNKILFQYRHHTNQDSEANRFFMDLELMDYLISDDYYKEKFNDIKGYLSKYLCGLFWGISKNYYKGKIDKAKYYSFFSYGCVSFIMLDNGSNKGGVLFLYNTLYHIRNLIKPVFLFARTIRSIGK